MALIEGATQAITFGCVYGDMGFDFDERRSMSYAAEREVTSLLFAPFSRDLFEHVYFEMPMEDLRVSIEDVFSDGTKNVKEEPTNVFAQSVANIGRATELLENAMIEDDLEEYESITKDIKHALGFYLVALAHKQGIQPTNEQIESCKEYIEPYL